MKKRCSFLVCLLVCHLAYADEMPIFIHEVTQPSSVENIVDPLNSKWQEYIKGGIKSASAVYHVVVFLMERLDKQQGKLDEQGKEIVVLNNKYSALQRDHESLQRAHDALSKKQADDSARFETIYKELQKVFIENNRFSGG